MSDKKARLNYARGYTAALEMAAMMCEYYDEHGVGNERRPLHAAEAIRALKRVWRIRATATSATPASPDSPAS